MRYIVRYGCPCNRQEIKFTNKAKAKAFMVRERDGIIKYERKHWNRYVRAEGSANKGRIVLIGSCPLGFIHPIELFVDLRF